MSPGSLDKHLPSQLVLLLGRSGSRGWLGRCRSLRGLFSLIALGGKEYGPAVALPVQELVDLLLHGDGDLLGVRL